MSKQANNRTVIRAQSYYKTRSVPWQDQPPGTSFSRLLGRFDPVIKATHQLLLEATELPKIMTYHYLYLMVYPPLCKNMSQLE